MAQQLRAGAPLAEDLSWVSSIHVEQLTLPVTPVPGHLRPPSLSMGTGNVCGADILAD